MLLGFLSSFLLSYSCDFETEGQRQADNTDLCCFWSKDILAAGVV